MASCNYEFRVDLPTLFFIKCFKCTVYINRTNRRYLSEGSYCLRDIQAGTFGYILFRKENILARGALEQQTDYLGAVLCSATELCKNIMLPLVAFISLPIIYLLYLLINNYFFP